MKVFAIVPVKRFENSKTRLSPILSPDDRIRLSSIMLEETLNLLTGHGRLQKVLVVSSDERARELAAKYGASFLHEDKDNGVNAAVGLADGYSTSHNADASVVIPQDLPLLDRQEISTACGLAESETRCMVISPSQRYDGTNLLLRKPPDVMPTYFDMNSYESHIAAAGERGIQVRVFLSKKLMMDIDTPDDLKTLVQDSPSSNSKVLEFIRQKYIKEPS